MPLLNPQVVAELLPPPSCLRSVTSFRCRQRGRRAPVPGAVRRSIAGSATRGEALSSFRGRSTYRQCRLSRRKVAAGGIRPVTGTERAILREQLAGPAPVADARPLRASSTRTGMLLAVHAARYRSAAAPMPPANSSLESCGSCQQRSSPRAAALRVRVLQLRSRAGRLPVRWHESMARAAFQDGR